MTNLPSPLATAAPWDLVAKDYAEVTLPFFEYFANAALDRANVTVGKAVLDVACGPGTLSLLAARRGLDVTAVDFASNMVQLLETSARERNLSVRAIVADGQALPLEEQSFVAAFSMFGLIFFPDRIRGLRELHRVLLPNGICVIASWQPMERFEMLSDVYTALRDLLPGLPFGQGRAPLGEPEEIIEEMQAAGFASIAVEAVTGAIHAASLDEAWQSMMRGSAPFALLRSKIGEAAWNDVERGIVSRLQEKYGSGPQTIVMTANLGIGRKPNL